MQKYALGFLFLLLPFSVSAASFQAGEMIEVETQGNAYAAGSVVQVTSEAMGDVYLVGGNVNINARIREDAFLAGKNVTINEPIGDDLHVFGETIIINNDIRGDLIAFGSTIIISAESRISGDVIIGADRITANGQFDQSVRLMGTHVETAGLFLKDVSIRTSREVSISDEADVRGNLHLLLPEGVTGVVPDGVVRGEITREMNPSDSAADGTKSIFREFHLYSLLSSILIGAIIIAFSRTFAVRFGEAITSRREYGKTLGMGFLALALPPLTAGLLFITFLGIPVAAIIIVWWGTLLYIGSMLSGLLVANIFFPLQKTDSLLLLIGKFSLASILLSITGMLPYVGFIISFIIFLLSIGSIYSYKLGTFKALRKSHYV